MVFNVCFVCLWCGSVAWCGVVWYSIVHGGSVVVIVRAVCTACIWWHWELFSVVLCDVCDLYCEIIICVCVCVCVCVHVV